MQFYLPSVGVHFDVYVNRKPSKILEKGNAQLVKWDNNVNEWLVNLQKQKMHSKSAFD